MIKCKIALLARAIVRDAETNLISVFNIIEQFNVYAFPALGPEISFFAYLSKDNTDPPLLEAKVRLSLDEELLLEVPITSDFGDKQSNRLIVHIGGLPLPKPGLLVAELFIDTDKKLASYEAKVIPIDAKPKVKVGSV